MAQADSKNLWAPVQWMGDAQVAFQSIKQELQRAPALGTPNHSNWCNSYASAVLLQEACQG